MAVGGTWVTGETSVGTVDSGTGGNRPDSARQSRATRLRGGLELEQNRATVAGLPRPAFWRRRRLTGSRVPAKQNRGERCRGRAEAERENGIVGLGSG